MTPPAKTASKRSADAPASAQKLEGQGKVELPKGIFGEPFHNGVVYEAVRAEQLARRQGTAATKTRGEVRGGGSKPWRQKGTGRARIGSNRAPHWTGGGAVFGPAPRGYTVKVNRKVHRRALRAALSVHGKRGSVAIVDAAAFEEPSAKQAAATLDGWEAKLPVLVILVSDEETCAKSFRNLDRVVVLPAGDAGVADVVGAASIVVSAAALDELARLAGEKEEKGAAAS
jgi:large subunit ribosomal protein L4